MTIEQIKAALASKKARKAELAVLINGPEDKREKDLDKLQTAVVEAGTLGSEIVGLEKDLDTALRSAAMESFRSNELRIDKPNTGAEQLVLSKRSAAALALGLAAKRMAPTEDQKRALNTALTTTAVDYVEPTATVNGVNNAGIFIDTNVILDLLREKQKLTPILNAVMFTNIKGLTIFPYRASRSKGKFKGEGKETGTQSFEFKKLTGKTGWLQINIDVTEESIVLSAFDLGAYLLSQIVVDLTYDWSEQIIYGDGTDAAGDEPAHIAGLTFGVTAATYTDATVLDKVLGSITGLDTLYTAGSTLYLSRTVYNKLRLQKNGDGNYLIPIYNSGSGLNDILSFPVAVDDTLHTGDYVFGNVAENYKANQNKGLTVEQDKNTNSHVYSFNASVMCTTIPVPGAFAYGKLSA